MKKGTIILLVLIIAAGALIAGCSKKDDGSAVSGVEKEKEIIRLTIGGGHPVTLSYTAMYHDFFIPEVNKRLEGSNYEIKWTEGWGGSISTLADQYESLESGFLDICDVGSMFEPVKTSGLAFVGFIPFNCPDPEKVAKAVNKTFAAFPEVVDDIYTNHNIKILTFNTTATYDFISTFEWGSVDDLAGVKVAAAGSNLNNLKGTDAITVQSSLNEAYTSFQTGVYDAWIMSADFTVAFKLNEVAPHLKKVGFGTLSSAQGINLNTWNKLPSQVQNAIADVAAEYGRKIAEKSSAGNEKAYEKILADGGTVTEFSDVERVEWAAMLPNIPMMWVEEQTAKGYPAREMMQTYFDALAEEGYEMPRDWLNE
jgi:TRAP-type C4-dicarboxylate transport system substrate-binding protein